MEVFAQKEMPSLGGQTNLFPGHPVHLENTSWSLPMRKRLIFFFIFWALCYEIWRGCAGQSLNLGRKPEGFEEP